MRWNTARLKKLAGCLLLSSGLLGCHGKAVLSQAPAPYAFVVEDSTLEMRDGVHLAVTYYRPVAKTPGETFPVIMEKVPYRKDDFFALGDYEYGAYFAQHGYVVARVDVRGTGGSGGAIPVSELKTAHEGWFPRFMDLAS